MDLKPFYKKEFLGVNIYGWLMLSVMGGLIGLAFWFENKHPAPPKEKYEDPNSIEYRIKQFEPIDPNTFELPFSDEEAQKILFDMNSDSQRNK